MLTTSGSLFQPTPTPSSASAKVYKKSSTSNPFKWVRPKSDNDPPKKPLSSYNIYFLLERDRIVNGEEEMRIYTTEDVHNIVEQQKWNHTYRKRQHRKTHGKVSFHDLSRVVANHWRQLSDDQKAIFNHQASVEKKIYKQALDTWVMKQMKQGRSATVTTSTSHLPSSDTTKDSTNNTPQPIRSMSSYENQNHIDPIMTTSAMENNHMHLLSSEEVNYLLGCFNMSPPPLTSSQQTVVTTTTNARHHHHHPDPNDWIRLDDNSPLWYDDHQLKGCSEEFALQMIHQNNNNNEGSSNSSTHSVGLDRAITL